MGVGSAGLDYLAQVRLWTRATHVAFELHVNVCSIALQVAAWPKPDDKLRTESLEVTLSSVP